MKIQAIIFFDPNTLKNLHSKVYDENTGFFQRKFIKEYVTFGSEELLQHLDLSLDTQTNDNCNFIVQLQDSMFYVYFHISTCGRYNENCGCALLFSSNDSDTIDISNSSKLNIQKIINQYDKEKIVPNIENILECFKIQSIQNELEQTNKTLLRTMSKVLKRGEKIEDLVEKTEHLSHSSKIFFKKSHNLNSCCFGLMKKW